MIVKIADDCDKDAEVERIRRDARLRGFNVVDVQITKQAGMSYVVLKRKNTK